MHTASHGRPRVRRRIKQVFAWMSLMERHLVTMLPVPVHYLEHEVDVSGGLRLA